MNGNCLALPSRCKRHTSQIWRKRVGVEPTIRPAKDRIAGFEGRESHRTLFAAGNSIAWDWWLMTGGGPKVLAVAAHTSASSPGRQRNFEVRTAGTRWHRPVAYGSTRPRGRKGQDWCRPRNTDAKWVLRLCRQEAIAARNPCAARAVPRTRRAALPHNTESRFACPRACLASFQWSPAKFPRTV